MKHKKTKSSSPPPRSGQSGSEKRSSGSSSPQDNSTDLKDVPLGLPEFTLTDHEKLYPKISSIVNCNDVELFRLQTELEGLLASTVLRKRDIIDEKEIVDNLEKYKGQSKLFRKQPSSPKRGFSGGEVRNPKKLKLTSFKQNESRLASNIRIKPEQETDDGDNRVYGKPSKGLMLKNDSAANFWSFVKPYCTPITMSHIEMVRDLIASHSENSDLLQVPKLGTHFLKESPDEQEIERFRGTAAMQGANSTENNQGPRWDMKVLSNKPEESPFGPHTQSLISALLEDDTMGPPDESLERSKKNSGSDFGDSRHDFIKSLDIRNAEALETRIMSELKDIGVLDSSDDDDENDEVLTELKKYQEKFKVIAEVHNPILHVLLNVATAQLRRQQLRDRLQAADLEVMETFKKIGGSRSKRGSLSQKEREQAWKVLKEREIIQKQLEGV